ncbi:MAG: type II toxin-antitoxin system VapC family toxin [Thiotrichales bacterium]
MYLLDTNVISEIRKGQRANPGVQAFFQQVISHADKVLLSAVTVGELRRGIELIRHRHDHTQAQQLEQWLTEILSDYRDAVIDMDADTAHLWGRLRVPHHEHALAKMIAATALLYDLTVVTRNVDDFAGTEAKLLNPFT